MINQVPTLFIGVGGIGMQIAATISDRVNENARDYVGFFGIDTDIKTINKRKKENHHYMNYIQISEDWRVDEFLELHPECEEWFPQDEILKLRHVSNGAGQIRSLSRLTFYASEEKNKFQDIFNEINRIRKIGKNADKNLVIVIVGSITGGTGAGMFIQLPFMLRKNLHEKCGVNHCTIRGMFIGPDITETAQHTPFMKQSVCVNGYTCLKELNAFHIHHTDERKSLPEEIRQSLKIEDYKHDDMSPDNVPYDYIYLYENSSNEGTVGDISVDGMIDYISRIAYNLLFTPIVDDAVSVEDNYIIDFIHKNLLNRYVGAGICTLKFPRKQAQDFVVLSLVNAMVEKKWCILDSMFRQQYETALERQKLDHSVELPSRGQIYLLEFDKEMKRPTGKIHQKYAEEAYDFIQSNQVSKMESYLNILEKTIDVDIVGSEQVKKSEEDCTMNPQKMKDFKNAATEVDRLWLAMQDNVKLINKLRSSSPGSVAEEFFPSTQRSMLLQKNSEKCIYGYLASVHPMVARFLIYDAIDRLEKRIAKYKTEIANVDLSGYLNVDFDKKTKDVIESAPDALSSLKSNANPLWQHMGFVGLYKESQSINKLKKQLRKTVDDHRTKGRNYLEKSIKLETFMIILNRLKALASAYEDFFDTISENIDYNKAELEKIEKLGFIYCEQGIYCLHEDFVRMYEEYQKKNGIDMELSKNTKAAVFEELCSIGLNSINMNADGITQSINELEMINYENREALERVFSKAIIETVRLDVKNRGEGIVNLSASEALKLEYNHHKTDSKQKYSDYVEEKMNTALRIATPMITTTVTTDSHYLVFLAMNSHNATKTRTDDGSSYINIDRTRTDWCMPKNSHVIVDDEFSDTDISVIKISYGHVIEDLIKYRPGSHNAKMYEERIFNLNNGIIINPDYDINPHLNRNWHEAAFVPAMQRQQRAKDDKDLVSAFILGLAFDIFVKVPYGDKKDRRGNYLMRWVADVDGSIHPITKCNKQIGLNFVDLYYSLLYNGAVKNHILLEIKKSIKEYKGDITSDALARKVMRAPFIVDLVQTDKSEENKGECNIFDIFLSMYSHMPSEEWRKVVFGLRDNLWEIFDQLFDGDVTLVNKKTQDVLTAIYNNSSLKSKKKKNEKETILVRYYKTLIDEEFVKSDG